jgi:hypothetical protein
MTLQKKMTDINIAIEMMVDNIKNRNDKALLSPTGINLSGMVITFTIYLKIRSGNFIASRSSIA